MTRSGLKKRQAQFDQGKFEKECQKEITRYVKTFERQLRLVGELPDTFEQLRLDGLQHYGIKRFESYNQLIAYCRHHYTNYDHLIDTLKASNHVSETAKAKCRWIASGLVYEQVDLLRKKPILKNL